MQVIRKIIDRKDIHTIIVPDDFGDKLEVIVLPFKTDKKKISRKSEYLMKIQERNGFVEQILNNSDEDVWNDV